VVACTNADTSSSEDTTTADVCSDNLDSSVIVSNVKVGDLRARIMAACTTLLGQKSNHVVAEIMAVTEKAKRLDLVIFANMNF
jgi:hypothetical protein